jgi:hypothetical protein
LYQFEVAILRFSANSGFFSSASLMLYCRYLSLSHSSATISMRSIFPSLFDIRIYHFSNIYNEKNDISSKFEFARQNKLCVEIEFECHRDLEMRHQTNGHEVN